MSSLTWSERAGQGTLWKSSCSLCSSRFAQGSKGSPMSVCLSVCWSCTLGSRGVCCGVCVCPNSPELAIRQTPLPGKEEGSFVCCKIPELGLGREQGTSWLWHRGRIFATRAITPFWLLCFYVHFSLCPYFKELIYF